jgi:hypothetical protein
VTQRFVREYPILFSHCDPAGIVTAEQGGDAPLFIPRASREVA